MRSWLIESRKGLELTQDDVATMAKIDRTHYAKIESGDRRPSPQVAQRIAKVLDINWQLFYPDEETSA